MHVTVPQHLFLKKRWGNLKQGSGSWECFTISLPSVFSLIAFPPQGGHTFATGNASFEPCGWKSCCREGFTKMFLMQASSPCRKVDKPCIPTVVKLWAGFGLPNQCSCLPHIGKIWPSLAALGWEVFNSLQCVYLTCVSQWHGVG